MTPEKLDAIQKIFEEKIGKADFEQLHRILIVFFFSKIFYLLIY